MAQIDDAAAQLTEVRTRLAALEKGRHAIMNAFELHPLPTVHLAALQARVRDESEIRDAAADLLARLRSHLMRRGATGADITLTYDGTAEDVIVVTAGTVPGAEPHGLDVITVPGAAHGVSVRFDAPPADTGDAWVALDSHLAEEGLATTGVYRQTLTGEGGVVLQAPVRELPRP